MGVIFDLDGVLVDTGWAHRQSWFDLAEREGFTMSDEFFYSTFGMQNYMIIPMVTGRELSRDEVDRMSDWKEQRYREIIIDHLEPSDGAEDLLDDLRDSGFRTAVGSSAPRANLDLVLERVNLRDCFDACVSGEQVTRGKPAPDTFLRAAEQLDLPPGCCAVVEDAVQGVEAGKAAGMPVVAVTTTRKLRDARSMSWPSRCSGIHSEEMEQVILRTTPRRSPQLPTPGSGASASWSTAQQGPSEPAESSPATGSSYKASQRHSHTTNCYSMTGAIRQTRFFCATSTSTWPSWPRCSSRWV